MASTTKNKPSGRQQNKNQRRFSEPREYGEILYGHKRKASSNLNVGNTDSKRVTRSRGQNLEGYTNNNNQKQKSGRNQKETQPSKIPLLNNSITRPHAQSVKASQGAKGSKKTKGIYTHVTPSTTYLEKVSGANDKTEVINKDNNGNHAQQIQGSETAADHTEGALLTGFLKEYGLNSEDPPPHVRTPDNSNIDLLQTLAFMNQRLKKLDKLEEMNTNLNGEITRVQAQVGEVSNKVTSVNSDLKRCEDKWEAGVETMMNRISKVEQGVQAFELKCESGMSDIQENISSLQANVTRNTSKVKQMEAQLMEYKEKWDSLESLEQKIKKAADTKFQKVRDAIQEDLREDLREEIVQEVHAEQAASKKERQYDRLKDRAFNKRHNLVLFGLPENSSPKVDRQAVLTFLAERMNFPKINIGEVYRLGTPGNRPRPLVVQFPNIVDRWAVWNKKGNIKFVEDQPIWMQEDLPKRLREDRRILQRVAKVAKSQPDKYTDVKVKDYKVFINGEKYSRDDLHHLPEELSLERVYTPRSDKATVFFTKNSPFSNHFYSPFTLEGIRYVCVEQYLAAHKAHLADDKELARQAMASSDPADHKVVLNKLRPVVSKEWAEKAPALITPAIRAKFVQNPNIAQFLTDSHPLLIGEASRDKVWGIGLSLEDPNALDDSKWAPEGNLLGRTLVSIREELLNS